MLEEQIKYELLDGIREDKELWRELPEDYVDGVRVTYDVKSVSQILDDGTEIPYEETKGYVKKVQLAQKLYSYFYRQ